MVVAQGFLFSQKKWLIFLRFDQGEILFDVWDKTSLEEERLIVGNQFNDKII